MDVAARIAGEISAKEWQVSAAVALLDEGSTVPFIARYRKEATGGLDDSGLRRLEERLRYLRELEERRETVLRSVREQGKLTPELESAIRAADTKTRLEDLYLPYRPKRRTRAQAAREAGLEPLARALLEDPGLDPQEAAAAYVNAEKEIADAGAALEGARWILTESFAEDPELAGPLREHVWETGRIRSRVATGKEERGAKFRDYFSFSEPLRKIPSHRMLALLRGRREKVLKLSLALEGEGEEDGAKEETKDAGPGDGQASPSEEGPGMLTVPEGRIAARFGIADRGRPADRWLLDAVRSSWRLKLRPRLETDIFSRIRERAEEEAIRVFASNLHDLLLAAPAGSRPTIGLDPGLRTGVKVAVIDGTGKLVDHGTIHPHAPRNRWDESIAELAGWAERHSVELVAIGNGTASRETDRLVRDLIRRRPELGLKKLVVSEAGASAYSASELASKEFPDLDVSLRGAVSIARRLQDPLAELVKIEPRSIGVGQYQHDVNQTRLARALDAVVEDCVNAVGVDLNTASTPLLARVSGLNRSLAENIVGRREEKGPFRRRSELLDVPRLGEKAFEQAAGFLRIRDGEDPLDASAVHPEAYVVVERIASSTGRDVRELIGNPSLIAGLDPAGFTDEKFGVPTVEDILRELEKPGRDPRPDFVTAEFAEGVEELKDLEVGMTLEGVVTNVTNFGAFVDVGVHQDGLVHISRLAERFVRDPREVVKAGDVVKVKVLDLDLERGRIGLTMRLEERREQNGGSGRRRRRRRKGSGKAGRPPAGASGPTRSPGGPKRRPEKERPPRRETTAFGRLLDATLAKAREKEAKGEKHQEKGREKEEQT